MTQKIQPEKNWIVAIAAIAGLVIMECFALSNGINGTLFSLVIAAVAGVGGYLLPSPIKKQ